MKSCFPLCALDSSDRKFKWMDSKPRTRQKQINRESRDNKAKSVGSLVVVNAASEAPTIEKDVLCRRLTVCRKHTVKMFNSPTLHTLCMYVYICMHIKCTDTMK